MCDFSSDGEVADVWTEREVKRARRARACSECGSRIQAGEPYRYIFSAVAGEGVSYSLCPACSSDADWLSKKGHFVCVGEIRSAKRYCDEDEA